MSQVERVDICCLDCNHKTLVDVDGREVVCAKLGCGRRFRVWSKPKQEEAAEFYASQPSVRRKQLRELNDARFLVSYVYEEAKRYRVAGLLDLIRDLETLRLMLLGVSAKIGLPLVIVFPVPNKWSNPEGIPVVGGFARLDCIHAEGRLAPACALIRAIVSDNDCHLCDAQRFQTMLQSAARAADGDLPCRYACWCGRTEFAYPILIDGVLVAVFIAGQLFLDTPQGITELEEGLRELQRRHPEFCQGVQLDPSQFAKTGVSRAELGGLLDRDPSALDAPFEVSTGDLRRLMTADARLLGRRISTDQELTTWKRRIADVVKVVNDYLSMIYRERRKLSESEFLTELFAVLDTLPSLPTEDDRQTWAATQRIVRRITEFQGFRNGAICYARADEPLRVRIGAWHLPAVNPMTPRLDPRAMSEQHLQVLNDAGLDWYAAMRAPSVPGTPRLLAEVNWALTGQTRDIQCGCIGFLRLRDEAADAARRRKAKAGQRHAAFAHAMLLLWDHEADGTAQSATTPVGQTAEFLKHFCFELSGGLRSWLSLLEQRRAEEARRQAVANSVHALRSSLHRVGARADVIDLLLEQTGKLNEDELRKLLKGIHGDLETFRHQLDLSNFFTVMEAGGLQYRIQYEKRPIDLVESCVRRLADSASRRVVDVVVEDTLLAETKILCDPGALEIAITAVIDNAIKYSLDHQKVRVKLVPERENVIIEVKDYGQGIVREDEKRIFEWFQRSQTTDPNRYVPGTGIGLAVALDVVKAHGGDIWFESKQGRAPSGHSSSAVTGHLVVFHVRLPQKRKKR